MSCKVAILLLSALFAAVGAQTDWCKIKNCVDYKKGVHTMCAYPKAGPQKKCLEKGDLGGGLSADDKNKIVNLHNQLRQKVAKGEEKRGSNGPQPKAKSGSIPNLQWDDALATVAQRWADQCIYEHDKCRGVPEYQVGQNMCISERAVNVSSRFITDMVQSWYDEVQHFNSNEVKKFSGNMKAANGNFVAHYTQVVWAGTTKIGCGLRNYHDGGANKGFLVCNYGPSGNFVGQAIYKT